MVEGIDGERRRFLGAAITTLAAAHLGMFHLTNTGESRELTAIGRATDWINSPRPTAAGLAGKVVVVDFWTYTCINWLRTLPYIRAWSQKYPRRLVVIGVHTPEFAFEHNLENVRRAVRQMRIDYPVVIDNEYSIWHAFNNQYWPAVYLVDGRGSVREHYFGEGHYDRAEIAIQRLLTDAGSAGSANDRVSVDASGIEAPADWINLKSSENYLGYERTENFASPGGSDPDRRRLYTVPPRLTLNQWGLAGEWTMGRQATVSGKPNGRIAYSFHSRDVHLVMGPPPQGTPIRFRVTIDGKPPGSARGVDVDDAGNGVVAEQRLYQLVRQLPPIIDRQFEIEFLDAGVETFAFTFG